MEARVEKPHRIAGYCRISVDVEADRDNTSIENQKDIISDYVQRYFPDSELTFLWIATVRAIRLSSGRIISGCARI